MKKPISVLIILIYVVSAPAATIYVDADGTGDYPTIQAAINDANNGDEIVLLPGSYTGDGNRDIDFLGKAITAGSTKPNDPCIVAETIIDCNGTESDPHRGFYFHNGEDANSVLNGLTIINGYSIYGGGIYCVNSCPTILNCTLKGNSAFRWGGGIYNALSSPTVSKSTFSENLALLKGGGAGMFNYSSMPVITNCWFNRNSASMGCLGGAMYNFSSDSVIANCTFSGNSTLSHGGAMYNFSSDSVIANCTFSGNSAEYNGGGMVSEYPSTTTITNCILWGNSDNYGSGESAQIDGRLVINYSCVQGWTGSFGGVGNISSNPTFVNPDSNDFHLLPISPCINTGDPNYMPEPNETDLDGLPRVIGGRIDMGAYEFDSRPVAVAGPNQTAYAFINGLADVNLDGSASYDNENDPLDYYWSWTIDSNLCEANGVSPTIKLPVGEHEVKLVVDDGIDESEPDYCTVTVIEPLRAKLWLWPDTLNCNSRPQNVTTFVYLPKNIGPGDVNNAPLIMYPCDIQSKYQRVFRMGHGRSARTMVIAVFDKDEICDYFDTGWHRVEVAGRLQTGRYFYGSNVIRITGPNYHKWPFHRFHNRH